jgi:hypothetical protein
MAGNAILNQDASLFGLALHMPPLGFQRRFASARVLQTIPAFDKAIQDLLPRRESSATR